MVSVSASLLSPFFMLYVVCFRDMRAGINNDVKSQVPFEFPLVGTFDDTNTAPWYERNKALGIK